MTSAPPTIPPPLPSPAPPPAARQRTQRQRMLLALALSLVLVVISAATLLVVLPEAPVPPRLTAPMTASPAVVLETTSLPAPPALASSPHTWANGNLSFAQDITFAPGHPQTGYACGSAGRRDHTIALGITHDSGMNWTALATTAQGAICRIRISASDKLQVAFTAATCAPACDTSARLYRSANGGATWTQAFLPDRANFAIPLGWAGGTLFAGTAAGEHPLAVSVLGRPFTFADDSQRFSGQPPLVVQNLIGGGGTMFAIVPSPATTATPAIPSAPRVIQSSDGGAVWSLVGWHASGLPVTFLQVASDGHTLVGLETDDTLVVSADLGQTWQGMTPFVSSTTLAPGLVDRLPDGALLATLHDGSAGEAGVYTLTPGSGAWSSLCAIPVGLQVVAVTHSLAGTPVAVWGAPTSAHGDPAQLRVYLIG